MATARMIANRLLEADEDFDPQSELERFSASGHPGIEIESEGNHWNVYKAAQPLAIRLDLRYRHFIGEITYDDMADMPRETMTPEQIELWDAHRWFASAGFRDSERAMCKTFDEALNFILAVHAVKTAPVRESETPDDPAAFVDRFAAQIQQPVGITVQNRRWKYPATNGKVWYVEISWEPDERQPMVTFYDVEHKSDLFPKGQHVSRYYASSIAHPPVGYGDDVALDLHSGVPEWKVDGPAMKQVREWLRDELETKRYYKPVDDVPSMGWYRYESLDPDDPQLYVEPDKFTAQPSYERLESSLRVMLRPYYDEIRISRRPAHLASVFTNVKDYWTWTIHCKRNTPLRLPKHTNKVDYFNPPEPVDWRKQVEGWFRKWAQDNDLRFYMFRIYGRLRKDPTFQFDTDAGFVNKSKKVGESEDVDGMSPEAALGDLVGKLDWENDLQAALWKFHPYGVGYRVIALSNAAVVTVDCYFPPDKDDFIGRLKTFVVDWLTQQRIMPVQSTKAYLFKHVGASKPEQAHLDNYPRWTAGVSVNLDWPPDMPEYVPPTVEIGQPGR